VRGEFKQCEGWHPPAEARQAMSQGGASSVDAVKRLAWVICSFWQLNRSPFRLFSSVPFHFSPTCSAAEQVGEK
jgi:hypothetical protein